MKTASKTTILVLANAIELSTAIISNVMGKEIGNTLNNSVVNRSTLNKIVASKITNKFDTIQSRG